MKIKHFYHNLFKNMISRKKILEFVEGIEGPLLTQKEYIHA